MTHVHPHNLASFVRVLDKRTSLGSADKELLLGLAHRTRIVDRLGYIAREGERLDHCSILVSGFAFSSRTCADGARAVIALHMDGDLLDIVGCTSGTANCDVQALTLVEVADIDRADICQLAKDDPQIGQALWHLTARTASVLAEWLISVGRRNARGRISHLICEIATRQRALGMAEGASYELPLTQEQLGDSTGLTSVHVNRVLRGMCSERLIAYDKRRIAILDWAGLKRAGDFRSGYLHLAD